MSDSIVRLAVPDEAEAWWAKLDTGRYRVILGWKGNVRLVLGELDSKQPMFRYSPEKDPTSVPFEEDNLVGGAERFDRLFAKAFTRAGWQLPAIDPDAFQQIVVLRRKTDARLEFILDTNAMVEGIGHWLAALFAERCDLVVTAVSLRELQDQYGGAKFGSALCKVIEKDKKNIVFEKDVISRRQTYLAAMRFRELTGFQRIVWRELELADASLLLTRSGLDKTDKKTSEADTTLLREVRRCIRDRVRGMERFFVTGDNALSRRAATELPEGSMIAARVRDLVRNQIYVPMVWWPCGVDQGAAIGGHTPMRLVWELLAIADEVKLRSQREPAEEWTFRAFDTEMWPCDYLRPWIDVVGSSVMIRPKRTEANTSLLEPAVVEQMSPGAGQPTSFSATEATPSGPKSASLCFPVPELPDAPAITDNFRIGTELWLDVLAALVRGATELPADIRIPNDDTERHLPKLLEGLGFAALRGRVLKPLPRLGHLTRAWHADDRDTVSQLMLPYRAYMEQVVPGQTAIKKRPDRTLRGVRGIAAHLGQGQYWEGAWFPGAGNPTFGEVRKVLLHAFKAHATITVLDLFTKVFLQQLAVDPVRVIDAWDRFEAALVFEGVEFRKGGGPPAVELSYAKLSAQGREMSKVYLDKFRGFRDLVLHAERRSYGG